MKSTEILILDFGRHPENSKLRLVLTAFNNDPRTLTMRLNPECMSESEWDEVLGNLINTKRCITL